MVAWTDYKTAAKERGSLALELFIVISTPVEPPEAVKSVLPDHLEYQRAQEDAGKLVFAGPLSDESGDQMEGMGLIVYRAASFDEAKSLAKNDPMHARKMRSYTLRRWLVNEGSFNLGVKLSLQSVELS